jgi:hypothetical protein
MTIADKLRYLGETKTLIKEAIQNKGVDVSDSDPFRAYAEKISQIQTGGGGGGGAEETVWAYYSDALDESKKVFLTKALNIMSPSADFTNGFYPTLIFNGFAYGTDDDISSFTSRTIKSKRQIVNGSIEASSEVVLTNNTLNVQNEYIPHFGLNGTFCTYISREQTTSHFGSVAPSYMGIVNAKGNTSFPNASSLSSTTPTFTEKSVLFMNNTTSYYVYRYDMANNTTTKSPLRGGGTSGFSFTNADETEVYRFYTTSTQTALIKWTVGEDTSATLPTPTFDNQAGVSFNKGSRLYLQTRDYRYLLHTEFYVDLDIEGNTITVLKYPKQIMDVLGDRLIHSVQILYNNTYALHIEDGTTLLCRYTEDIADSTFDVIAPLKLAGDNERYYRAFSPDAMYWWVIPRSVSGALIRPGVEEGPANVTDLEKAETEFHAYLPVKERFNSTVLSGFATEGEREDTMGRRLIKVKTVTGA